MLTEYFGRTPDLMDWDPHMTNHSVERPTSTFIGTWESYGRFQRNFGDSQRLAGPRALESGPIYNAILLLMLGTNSFLELSDVLPVRLCE